MKKNVPTLLEALAEARAKCDTRIAEIENEHKSRCKRLEQFYCFLQEGITLNYIPEYSQYDLTQPYFTHLNIPVKNVRDFVSIHKLVGNLEHMGMIPKKEDGRCREVIVTLRPKGEDNPYRFMRFQFEKKLPKNGKCKIVTRKENRVTVQCTV